MRWGTVDPFLEKTEWHFRMGRTVANQAFLKALFTHGTYEHYELFCPDAHSARDLAADLERLVPDPLLLGRVVLRPQVELAQALRSVEYDVFHLSDFAFSMPFLAGLRNRHAKRLFPLTGVTHSLDGVRMSSHYLELLVCGLMPCDAIVATSVAGRRTVEKGLDFVRKNLQGLLSAALPMKFRVAQIPLGVDEALFSDLPKNEARAHFRLPKDAKVILSVGRLSSRSKCDWSAILELFARMNAKAELADTFLVIAGGAMDQDIRFLEQLVESLALRERVLVFPNFPPETKTILFRAADIYLSLVDNIQETFGLSIVEAMAAGLPVIASDYSGYRDIVRHGETGILIPTVCAYPPPEALTDNLGILDASIIRYGLAQGLAVDLECVRRALLQLLGNEELAQSLGENGRKRARTYLWPQVILAYEALWAELRKMATLQPREMVPDVLWGDLPATFAHFATRRLVSTNILAITELGLALEANANLVRRTHETLSLQSLELEALLLSTLARGPTNVAALRAGASPKFSSATVDFHLVWLLKHGALRLD